MSSVLTSNAQSLSAGSMTDALYARIAQRAATQVQQKQTEANTALQEKSAAINAESDRWITVKAGIMNARLGFDNGLDGIKAARSALLEMRNQIVDSTTDNEFARSQFDAQVNAINNAVDGYAKEYNPVGNVDTHTWDPNTIEYRTDLGSGTASITGVYAGADFKITLADGSMWRPDPGTGVIERYGTDGVKTEDSSSMLNGVTLNSYDSATGAISMTIVVDSEDEDNGTVTVNGTLERGGIGVMPSWFYNNFATEADRDAARADIEAAEADLTLKEAQLVAGQSRTISDERKADTELDELTAQRKDALEDSLRAQMALQTEVQRQYQVMVTNLANVQSEQDRYANVFASTIQRNPFLRQDV